MSQVRVKICGITCVEDAIVAAEAGAQAVGLNFYASSPRYLADLHLARQIAMAVGPFVTTVGLFVDPEPDYVNRVLAAVPLQLLQFHGAESPEFCTSFNRPYLKAVRMKADIDLPGVFARYATATGILLDAYRAGVPGGTGETFDWQRVPQNPPIPVVLAGGLTADNVAAAIAQTNPYAVDISSGVEEVPGRKSATKIFALMHNATCKQA